MWKQCAKYIAGAEECLTGQKCDSLSFSEESCFCCVNILHVRKSLFSNFNLVWGIISGQFLRISWLHLKKLYKLSNVGMDVSLKGRQVPTVNVRLLALTDVDVGVLFQVVVNQWKLIKEDWLEKYICEFGLIRCQYAARWFILFKGSLLWWE